MYGLVFCRVFLRGFVWHFLMTASRLSFDRTIADTVFSWQPLREGSWPVAGDVDLYYSVTEASAWFLHWNVLAPLFTILEESLHRSLDILCALSPCLHINTSVKRHGIPRSHFISIFGTLFFDVEKWGPHYSASVLFVLVAFIFREAIRIVFVLGRWGQEEFYYGNYS